MTREMQDGINTDAAGMDHTIPLVAYYIDGLYAWTAAEIALFPRSVHVRIAVRSTTRDGHVIDRENGDATAAQAAAWAHQRRLDGYPWPAVYCSVSNQAEVIAAFQAIHEPMPLWWLAHYDNVDVLPPGAIAKQYADPGPLDRSVVADYWPGVDQGGTAMDWSDPLPNPLYDKTITDPADVRSHPNYSAAQYIQGSWVNTLQVGTTMAAEVANLAKVSTLLSTVAAAVAGDAAANSALQTAIATVQSSVSKLGGLSGGFTITGSGIFGPPAATPPTGGTP